MPSNDLPLDRMYSAEHEWVTLTAAQLPVDPVRVGITRLAANNLGDLVFIDLPSLGTEVTAGQPCGEVESTKAASELVAPVSGSVIEVNNAVADDPTIVSTDPYDAGWLFAVQVTALGPLMTAAEYDEHNRAAE